MARINIASGDVAEFIANQWLDNFTQFDGAEKTKVLPATKYNVGVNFFNLGAICVIYSVAMALLAKFSVAIVIGVVGYAMREFGERVNNWRHSELAAGATLAGYKERVANALGMSLKDWSPALLSYDEFIIFKDYLPLPV